MRIVLLRFSSGLAIDDVIQYVQKDLGTDTALPTGSNKLAIAKRILRFHCEVARLSRLS
jgi:hypothetical protein